MVALFGPGVVGALGQVHPKSFFGVPRVWEKMVAGLKNLLGSLPEEKRNGLIAANELLQQGYKLRSDGKEVPPELAEKIAGGMTPRDMPPNIRLLNETMRELEDIAAREREESADAASAPDEDWDEDSI